jgi:hypothetical protein
LYEIASNPGKEIRMSKEERIASIEELLKGDDATA